MWNFSYAIPTILVLAVFLLYYFTLPRIPIRMNRTFVTLLMIETLVMLSDIVSTWADMNHEIFPIWILYVLNSVYFLSFFARGFYFFVFTASALRIDAINDRKFYALSNLPLAAASLIVIFAPFNKWFYYMDQSGYHSGELYNILYALFWFYLLLSFFCIFTHTNNLRGKRELTSVVWYNVILFLGSIIRLMFPKYLLMDVFCLIAVIVIYLSFMNPEFYLEGHTWIFNRRSFLAYIEEISGKKAFSIFTFTIHNYRDVRELYGVNQMDRGIRLIADYLRKEFSSQKVFYHRSGRFVILCENGEDYGEINRKLQERFRKPWRADDAELFLEIGCALLDIGNNKYDHNTMIQLLTTAFAEAEKADKNGAVIIDSSYVDKACHETEIKKSIEYALDYDCVEVFLQPIVDANTGKMVGAEALSRIRDSSGQLIPPGLFIPIAEHNGRIDRLGEQVFIKTCKFFRDYDVQSMGLTFINVNLSPIQFMRQDVGDIMITEAKKYGVPPEFIHLEITEEALIDDHLLVEQTNYIRGLGFNFVLDDYGKGYSNMTRLKSIPFINVKLDMSTVWDYCSNPDDVLPNMVKTFRGVGFSITAEGIEDEVMAEKMRNIGVTYLQGYHFSKPLPMSDFVKKYST